MALSVKSAIGLSDIYYAVQTSDDPSGIPAYGPVYSLPGAKALAHNSAAALTSNFADDQVWELMESTGEQGITLTVVDMLPADQARVLGHTYANGAIIKKETDVSPYVAIMGKVMLSDGSYGYVRYYKVKFGKANSEDSTKEATPAPRTMVFEGRVASLQSTTYKAMTIEKLRSDDPNVDASYLANFFNSVTFSSGNQGALTVAAAAGTAGQIVFTFTKAGGGTNVNEATLANGIGIYITSTGAKVTPTALTLGASGGATQTVTATGLTAVGHTWTVSGVTDSAGVLVTPKVGTVTVT
jgi:phi13 family phage major tail protein